MQRRKSRNENKADDDDEMCVICYQVLRNHPGGHDLEPVGLKCTKELVHVYHRACIVEWMSGTAAINQRCPICRHDPREADQTERARLVTLSRLQARRDRPVSTFLREAWSAIFRDDFQRGARIVLGVSALVIFFVILLIVLFVRTSTTSADPRIQLHPVSVPDYDGRREL